jgi:hypothetical protein
VTARPDIDPAPATRVAGAGSRRPGVVPLLVAAVALTAVVQGLVVESSFVPTSGLAPTLEAGDRVLVWKVRPAPGPGDVVVVDTSATAEVDRSTPVDDGLIGRTLSGAADLLGIHPAPQHRLAVVASTSGDRVRLGGAVPTTVPSTDVVGTVVLRFWPIGRLGAVHVQDDRLRTVAA